MARLTLKGNFVWLGDEPQTYIDGDSFGAVNDTKPTEVILPSGNGRPGGDFEMWFRLQQEETPPIKIKAEEKIDPKISDKVDNKIVVDVKVQENLSAPGGKASKTRKGSGKTKPGGKAFIRKKERPAMDPEKPKKK